jgi:lauroyl/myristoyl acyltransferase
MANKTSSLYQAGFWQWGMSVVRHAPESAVNVACIGIGSLYFSLNAQRRRIVIENLLPALNGNKALARKTALRLFQQFAVKLADLWRMESGLNKQRWRVEEACWQMLLDEKNRGTGVLLVSPHLGNWELGGMLLADRGMELTVITQPEPTEALTKNRIQSRLRWGIKTVVVGNNGFLFVEVIKILNSGGVIALLVDRPLGAKSAEITLFGRRCRSSFAVAELARATGCRLLGSLILREKAAFSACLLPPFEYSRAALRDSAARVELTQRIMSAFEPTIRRHLDQWYHFQPYWIPS